MAEPVPYGQSTLDNSPLFNVAIGSPTSNFPCKQRPGVYDITKENHYTIGTDYPLVLTGSASHGGGSAQLSLTRDREPTAHSTFKAIYTYIGGFPTTTSSGGTGNHTFQIPDVVPDGTYSFVWFWVSKLSGQPERYENCAPVTISGSKAQDYSKFDALPDMFIVNLPSSDCGSQASTDLIIPDPGQYVTTLGTTALASATGAKCAAVHLQNTAARSGSNAAPTLSSASGYAPASMSAVPVVSSAPASEVLPTSTSAAFKSMTSAVPSPSTYGYHNSSASAAPTGGPLANGTGPGKCSTEGAILCNGPTQFGLCNYGSVVWESVAAGTACSGGKIVKKRDFALHTRHPHGRRMLS
ncbi:hypothetical protein LTR66_005081 [Elasticomyces elasticus]|nr:hypothetical protein LTR66_005081 [Elasticomyces elasticus]